MIDIKAKSITILLTIFILFSTQIIASVAQPKDHTIFYHSENNLHITSFIDGGHSQSYIQNSFILNSNINEKAKIFYKNQSFSFSPDDLTYQLSTDHFKLFLNDSTLFNQPGLPLVPMKTMTFTLPKNSSVKTIDIMDYSLKKSEKAISFQQTPFPHFWSTNITPLQQHADEIISQTISEAEQNPFYPGTTHTFTLGKNNTNTKVILHLFPIQYQFDTKETYLMDQGTIIISYTLDRKEVTSTNDLAQNIIITHPSFLSQAKKLQQFHNNQGIQTEVVTTKWINSHYEPSSYPPIIGYKDFSYRNQIQKYDDELARKIISFLQSQSTNQQLKFVTILGNAIHVPPSYYFGYDYYPVPTDFYYSSPDLDLIPNYRIGRLPVHTIFEASRTINKIINWNPTDKQMDNVAIAGGIPFNSPFFIGELITIDSVNRGFFDGLTVDKYYRTEERFESTDILSALQNDYGLLFMISHGNANLVVAEEGRMSARTIGAMPKNNNAPILSCIACSSGSYDTHLIKQGYSFDKTSFGEAIVVSKGGGIAYIGGSRTNDGYPLLTLIDGRVEISKETYMAGLLTYLNQAYRNNLDHLGDLTYFAAETYLQNNDLTDFWNQYHYLDFILLGDPALQLPNRSFPQNSYQKPQTSAFESVGIIPYESTNHEYNGTISLHAIDEQASYESQTDSPFINLKKIETGNYQNVEVNTSTYPVQNENVIIQFTSTAGNLNLLRFETVDGKEDWMYYRTARPVNNTYTSETKGFGTTRWDSIQDAINNANSQDCIYVFKGTYNESVNIDRSCLLQGEDKTRTIIDGNGNDDVVSISSDGVTLSRFTIQHCGKNPWNAGISIHPKKSLNSIPILIDNNIIKDNKNCGIYLDVKTKLFGPIITLLRNDILYNNYGVYIQNGASEGLFMYNNISGNNFGIYLLESKQNMILGNNISNNYVGLFLKDVKKTDIVSNNFIDNTQDCQFSETRFTRFSQNYWDNWIGHLFNRKLPIPKLINGIYDDNQNILSQIKIDFRPLKEPIII